MNTVPTCPKLFSATLIVIVVAFGSISWASDLEAPVDMQVYGVAIQGYDPVAYFTEGGAVKGLPERYFDWNDARWYFASARNRDMFAADPKRYAPSHSGFCAVSFSAGKFAGMDPLRWKIVDGKLFLGWVKADDDGYYQNVEKILSGLDD